MKRPARRPQGPVVLALVAVAMLPATAVAAGTSMSGATAPGAATVAVPQPVVLDSQVSAWDPTVSHSGRFVAHRALRRSQTDAPLQVRRADLLTGTSELLNPRVDGGFTGGSYSAPVISGDGSRVAFSTTSPKLVAQDTNTLNDAFVRDANTDETHLASRAFDGTTADGHTGAVSLSRSGRYAVFTSRATDVVPGSTYRNVDVYRRDLTTRTTVQVTVRRDGTPSRGPGATTADVSADGRLVAFDSFATDLAANDGDTDLDLFVRNLDTGTTRWLSPGVPAGASPSGVVISPNGAWVSSRWADGTLHLTDVRTRVTTIAAPEGYAGAGAFSGQLGRFVYIAASHPRVRDLATGADDALPVPAGGTVANVAISGNGRYAAYDWFPDDLGASRIFRVALD